MTEALSLRAVRAEQGDGVDVYSFFMRGSDVLRIADISRVHRDEVDELKGFQRKEIQNHVKGIVEYLDRGNVIFPNAIILAFQGNIDFKQSRGPSPDGPVSGTLTIPVHPSERKTAWIVDGQQRAFALSRTKNEDIMVPVVGFVAPSIDVQREQFILVNKAKPLPKRLINELLPEISAEIPADLRPAKIPSELCNLLNHDPKSPFYKLIRRMSDEDTNTTAVIVDTALINAMKQSINNYGALALYKNTTSDGHADVEGMYRVMCVYWSAVKKVFPEAWGLKPQESRLMHSAGIQAMGVLMDRIMPRMHQTADVADEVEKCLRRIAPYCSWTDGTWEGLGLQWNEIQNLPRHIKALAEYLVQVDFAESQRQVQK
ncbi:DGQHR domain-containing protein DpdB [Ruegeria sp. HKCCSP335]|uniref:DGQHR domain-containing protein DpdB n=1 Tax=Ruegeria sp. HKCCSP335 TaxID=2794833 RepID=UPI001AE29928|nr:DGQHR domain-containing protein DpdB [Ruegeria sp. HKCCSP335]